MTKFDDSDGVWRTIGGRRVFIKDGQSLSDAMKESGKFKSYYNSKTKRMLNEKHVSAQEAVDEYNKKQEQERLKNEKILKDYEKKEEKDEEYKLYKKAKENPDSIDPMTENSTDWEALDEKYKDRYEKEKTSQNNKNDDNKSIKQLNNEMLGDRYKGKGETPSQIYSNDRKIDIATNENGGKTATVWKDGKIERKTNLPENVSGDKTKDYFDKYLKELDNSNAKSTNEAMNNAIREKAFKNKNVDNSDGFQKDHDKLVQEATRKIDATYKNITNEERQKLIDKEVNFNSFDVGEEEQKQLLNYFGEEGTKAIREQDEMMAQNKKRLEELQKNPTKENEYFIKLYKQSIAGHEDAKKTIYRGMRYKKQYEDYKKEHPESKMSFWEFKNMIK